ncbi:hypothetical protein KUCAC02_033905, partial [Chaenocephalus aceratus]
YRRFDLEHLRPSGERHEQADRGAARAHFVGPPSAPQNLVYNINQTSVSLEWSPPADTGGRNDVTYRVVCRRCSWEPEECVQCGPNVGFSPAQAGLVESYVSIMDLLAHANYTFEVEAVNGGVRAEPHAEAVRRRQHRNRPSSTTVGSIRSLAMEWTPS